MESMPDEQLVQQIAQGDEEALVLLHQRYADLVYSVAFRILNDPMAAEELTQDAFMRLWRKAYTFDSSKGRFIPWLMTVTRRLAIDMLRQRRQREPQLQVELDEDPELSERLLTVDGSDTVRYALRSLMTQLLSREQRDAIELAYFYAMSHSEIADYLQVPLGTIKTRILRGMQTLREAWLRESHPKSEN